MILGQLVAALTMVLLLAACSSDTFESVSNEIDELLTQQISMTMEDEVRARSLCEQAEQLQREGKAEESVKALKQTRGIVKRAADAELLRESEG